MASQRKSAFETELKSQEIQRYEIQLGNTEIVVLDSTNEIIDSQTNHQIFVGFCKISQNVQRFTNVEKCLAHIEENNDHKTILLLPTALPNDTMNQLQNLPQIISIYQLDSPNPCIMDNSTQADIQSVEAVNERVQAYLRVRNDDFNFYWTSGYADNTNRNTASSYTRTFFEYLFLVEMIFHMNATDQSFLEFITYCREHFRNDHTVQQEIDKFSQEYRPHTSIEWYTKQMFLYRVTSSVFRRRNIQPIFKTRHFSIDLYQELRELHGKHLELFDNDYVKVYRGKRMSIEEFQRFKASIGELVMSNSFLSTTLDEKVASFYVNEGAVDQGFVAVIMHILIDKRVNSSKPFAYIGDRSFYRWELEVLLPVGMIFKNLAVSLIKVNPSRGEDCSMTLFIRKITIR